MSDFARLPIKWCPVCSAIPPKRLTTNRERQSWQRTHIELHRIATYGKPEESLIARRALNQRKPIDKPQPL